MQKYARNMQIYAEVHIWHILHLYALPTLLMVFSRGRTASEYGSISKSIFFCWSQTFSLSLAPEFCATVNRAKTE